jgi:signal transduction histidine kinase/integral membrane sensor domain MASE1
MSYDPGALVESRAATARASGSALGRNALLLASVGATYFLGAQVGLVLRFPPATTSVIWPPNALLTAALLLTPRRRWWLCVAAALPAHVLVESLAGFPPGMIAALFASNCLEALVAASAVRLWSDEPTRFDTLQRALAFVGGAVLLGPFVSTFADAAAVHAFQGEPYPLVWMRRILSNSLSQLLLVPSAVVVVSGARGWLTGASRRRRAEAVLLALALGGVGGLVFSGYQSHSSFLPGGPYTALPFLMPLLVFGAVRFGPGGASLSLLATALLAIGGAMSGWTPLTGLPAEERVTALQVFLVVVGVPLLLVSALMRERQRIADTLRQRLAFEELLSQLSGAFVHLPSDQMDREFEARLGRIGTFLELDRVSLWRFLDGSHALVPLAWWSAPGADAPPPQVERAEFPWGAERLLRQELFVCSDSDALPPDANEDAALLRRHGVRSVLALPLLVGDRVLGTLSLVATRRRVTWSEDLVRHCSLLADIFGGVLARKLAEDALRASESMKSAVLASLTSLVAVLDRDGRIIAVNESWTRFGRGHAAAPGEVVGPGASYLEVCRRAAQAGDELAHEALVGIEDVLARRRPGFAQEYGFPSGDRDRWFHMTAVPLDRPEGGAVVSQTDVTERRAAELEAAQSRQELAHFLRVSTIGELTSSIAHELNQPLAAILANAQTARKLLAAPDTEAARCEVTEIVADIIDEDRRAGDVIRGLRELLRKGELTREELDVNALVTGVVRLLGNDVMLRGVSLRCDLAREAFTTRGDRVQLQQVLLNLVLNALEALAEREGDKRVGIRTERAPGGMVRVSVEDNGPGLPAPVRQEIFKPFFTTKPMGMGMGLSIARSILGAHGGTLALDTEREHGARFSFTLPLVDEHRSPGGVLG